jgi:hypothetical protein
MRCDSKTSNAAYIKAEVLTPRSPIATPSNALREATRTVSTRRLSGTLEIRVTTRPPTSVNHRTDK